MVMKYNMMLLNISFDELMLQCVCVCIVQEKNGAKSAGKKNFLGRLLIADLKSNILKSARRVTSTCKNMDFLRRIKFNSPKM
jgi:hypothetical protein